MIITLVQYIMNEACNWCILQNICMNITINSNISQICLNLNSKILDSWKYWTNTIHTYYMYTDPVFKVTQNSIYV